MKGCVIKEAEMLISNANDGGGCFIKADNSNSIATVFCSQFAVCEKNAESQRKYDRINTDVQNHLETLNNIR